MAAFVIFAIVARASVPLDTSLHASRVVNRSSEITAACVVHTFVIGAAHARLVLIYALRVQFTFARIGVAAIKHHTLLSAWWRAAITIVWWTIWVFLALWRWRNCVNWYPRLMKLPLSAPCLRRRQGAQKAQHLHRRCHCVCCYTTRIHCLHFQAKIT